MFKNKNRLLCFSPPVMLATFAIEMGLFLYVLTRYKLSPASRLVAALLICLALFQLAEYNVCDGMWGLSVETWSRIGYVAITLLPAMALHLIVVAVKGHWRWRILSGIAYLSSILWTGFFLMHPSAFAGHECAGNYAIFQLGDQAGSYYFVYYYLWLFVGVGMCLRFILSAKPRVRHALLLILVGYLSFIIPTAITNTVNPETIRGIPSVMCGFAVIFALLLTFYIVPDLVASKTDKARATLFNTKEKPKPKKRPKKAKK